MRSLLESEPRSPRLERVTSVLVRLVRETVAHKPGQDERIDDRTGIAESTNPLEDREIERGDVVTGEPVRRLEESESLRDPGRSESVTLAVLGNRTNAPYRADPVELQSVAFDVEYHARSLRSAHGPCSWT